MPTPPSPPSPPTASTPSIGPPTVAPGARLGIGSWHMGESAGAAAGEIAALRSALDQGVTLIDTAEMYGDGGAETVVGRAIAGRREACTLVSKVLPHHANRRGTIAACERSLKRLGTDHIDLYLLHWRGPHPLAETLAGFDALVAAGKIGRWGVSNFDVDDLRELLRVAPAGACAANQVYYSLSERGIDHALKPLHDRHGIVTMAYCPFDGGTLVRHPGLASIAARLGATPAQVALAWLLSRPSTWPVPMTRNPARAVENAAATRIVLTPSTLAELDALFPPPTRKTPLAIV